MYNRPQDLSRTIERNKNKISFLKKSRTIIQRVGNIKFNNFLQNQAKFIENLYNTILSRVQRTFGF